MRQLASFNIEYYDICCILSVMTNSEHPRPARMRDWVTTLEEEEQITGRTNVSKKDNDSSHIEPNEDKELKKRMDEINNLFR